MPLSHAFINGLNMKLQSDVHSVDRFTKLNQQMESRSPHTHIASKCNGKEGGIIFGKPREGYVLRSIAF